jgi:hypothetical protein
MYDCNCAAARKYQGQPRLEEIRRLLFSIVARERCKTVNNVPARVLLGPQSSISSIRS